MKTLDEIATMAVADVRVEAAQIADTESALADARGEVQLVAAAPIRRMAPRRRPVLMMGAAAAACVAVIVAAVVVGSDDQSLQPAESPSTTEAAPTTTGDSVPSMSSPIWDEATGSEIVYQFTRQWEECPPDAFCGDPRPRFLGPLVTTRGQIILGEVSSPGWLVIDDGAVRKVAFGASWELRDAAVAPDDSVYAVFNVSGKVQLYRYVGADMASPELIGEPHSWGGAAAVVLDLGGTSGAERIDFADGVFTVRRPMFLASPTIVPGAGDELLVDVKFVDGNDRQYHVSPGRGRDAAGTSVHPLATSAVIMMLEGDVDLSLSINVLLPDGSMRERVVPLLVTANGNTQRFVDEGYYYLLTAESTTVGTSTTAVYSVRRFALPTADEPPVVEPTTVASSSTTTVAARSPQLEVSGDSIAGLQFGLPIGDSLPLLNAALGDPSNDESLEMSRIENGVWSDDFQNFFTHRFSREVCWAMDTVCAIFGGDTADTLVLVGWSSARGTEGSTPVITESGLAHGSVWADHPEVVLDPPGSYTSCYSIGYATTPDGIRVVLESTTSMFASWDADGNLVETVPPADGVTVIGMWAGEQLGTLADDC